MAVWILVIFLIGGAATLASAFSVDVKKLYYADYTNSSTTRRVINYDFSGGSLAGSTITIPAGPSGVAQVPAEEVPPLTYTFGPPPDPENDIAATLDTGAGKATLTTATDGALIINVVGTPNTPPVAQWVFAAALTNFTGMTDDAKEYETQIGFGSMAGGPHPELDAAWVPAGGGVRNLVVRAAIYDDNLEAYTWGPFTVPVAGFNPATGVIVLRIRCLDPAAGGNTMVFDYSLDGGTNWIPVQTLTFGFAAGNVPMDFPHLGLFDKVPFVSLQVQQAGAGDPFQVSSQHWNDAQGNVYHAWPRVMDSGSSYSAVTVNSPGYLAETPMAFNGAAGYWSLSGTLFTDDFTGTVIDAAKWTTAGGSVSQNGYLHVEQAAQDAGGKVMSRAIPINPYAEILVQRKARVASANNYFDGLFGLYFGNTADFASGFNLNAATMSVVASHANYSYSGGGTEPANGFYLGRYAAHFPNPATTSAPVTPVWGTDFNEKIVYNPVTGVAQLFIDDMVSPKATVTVGALPSTARYLVLYSDAWGWYTGHYNYTDDVTVSQPWTGGNVFLSNNTPPADPVVFNFTAMKQAGGSETVSRTISGYVTQFAADLQPAGNVTTATPTFSWTGVTGATGYAVQVYDANGNRIWNKYAIPSSTRSAVYGVAGTPAPAPALELGQTYGYEIVTSIVTNGINNDSFAKGSFTYTTPPPATLSLSGSVKVAAVSPTVAVSGALVEYNGGGSVAPVNTDPSGNFLMSGIPQGQNFDLRITKAGFTPVYSEIFNWTANIQGLLPYGLFPSGQLGTWGVSAGNGAIIGRVSQLNSPNGYLSGATVTAVNAANSSTSYPVTYLNPDGVSFGGAATQTSGIFAVLNVPAGVTVQLTASLAGWTFAQPSASRWLTVRDGAISEASFFGTPPATISFSGYVLDSASTPNPVAGALIEKMGAIPPKTTTSITNGSYTLAGLPAGVPFHLKASKDTYAPAYTGDIWSSADISNTVDQGLNLFPANQLAVWGIDAGKGIIRARVRDQARTPIGGVVISATSQLGQTYPVCYDDACSALTSTQDASGRYIIRNVLPGDVVTVTATKPGWTFGSRSYHTYAGGISQFGISGTDQNTGADELAIRNGIASAAAAVNAKNAAGFMTFVSDAYLNDGENKAVFAGEINWLITNAATLSAAVGSVSIQNDLATVQVTWTLTMGGLQQVDPETLIFKKVNGSWLIYGNQRRHEVKAVSQHWANGYYGAFTVGDPSRTATAATVTGFGIAGSLGLTRHEDTWDGQPVYVFWNETQGPSFGTSIPATNPTYTITVTEPSGPPTVYNVPITGWIQNFATNLSPSGQAGGPVIFSWTGVSGVAEYSVELSDSNWNRIWNIEDIPANRTWALYGETEEGQIPPPLVPGGNYRYQIVARDANGNGSFAPGQFTYGGTAGISFTGQVTAATGGAALQGVAVTMASNPNPTPSATSDGSGNFILSGLPAGSSFTIKLDKEGFRPTYTAIQKSLDNLASGAPFGLFTPADTAAWPVNFTTKGAIATRVVDSAGSYIAGAVVTAQSMLHPEVPYSVTYRDDAGNFGGIATYGNGRFYVLGVDEGDIVTVTAAKKGYAFNSRKYHTRAGGVSQGRITGTVGLFSGDVNHDGRLSLADAVLALQLSAGVPATVYTDADVNGDGRIDTAELVYILQSVAGLR